MSDSGWKTLKRERICPSPYVPVWQEIVATPTRPDGIEWTVARRPTAAVVAPRTPDGRYVLIRQERIPIQRAMWEFPAGQVEGEITEESIRATAFRELIEETGLHCTGELIPLDFFYSSAGFTDERGFLFLATDVVPHEKGASPDELEAILEVRAFSADELRHMVATGEIFDANTLSVFARLTARGLLV